MRWAWCYNLITDYLSRKPPVLNTTIIPPPLCVYPITDPSSSSGSSSTDPNDILNMIENLSPEIKDQVKTLTLEARSKRIIKTLHDYLKRHQCHFLAIFPDIDQPWKTFFAFWITNWTVAHYLYIWYLMNLGCSDLGYFIHSPSWASFFKIPDHNLWKYLFPWGKI